MNYASPEYSQKWHRRISKNFERPGRAARVEGKYLDNPEHHGKKRTLSDKRNGKNKYAMIEEF